MPGLSLRTFTLALIAAASVVLALGALFVDDYRDSFIYAPREQVVVASIGQIAARQRALHESGGRFIPFGASDVESNPALLDLNWNSFPTDNFLFDAETLESGGVRLRALPRPERVSALEVRARMYVTDLGPTGEVLHSGWLPED